MRSCRKVYTIVEHDSFTREISSYGYQALPTKVFDALESFILANNNSKNVGTEAIELLSISTRRGLGKIITAKNYVGLITMSDGTVIEILPKIVGGNITESDTKRIFLEMLKTLKDVPFKDFYTSHLHTDRLNLLEIFIKMFLDEVSILTKQGLKSAYIPLESNERVFKGKLLACHNIRYNLVNKERVYVCYDDFSINRPENRLIKSTLRFLFNSTSNGNNRQHAARLMNLFDGVEYSNNYDMDFSKCFSDRSMNHYSKVLSLCRIFLKGNSFTAFAGSEVAFALLFPMEKVFESFVASKFRKHINSSINLRTQDSRFSLFDNPNRAFALRPDIVLEFGGNTIVLDTKWKILSNNIRNNGISQADMYQIYAYSKKYDADSVILIYPYSDAVSQTDIRYSTDDDVNVKVFFVDLKNSDECISSLLSKVII